jgi:hypothetical protein
MLKAIDRSRRDGPLYPGSTETLSDFTVSRSWTWGSGRISAIASRHVGLNMA